MNLYTLEMAVEKFGESWQVRKCKEELFELILELSKVDEDMIAKKNFPDELIDEVADALIMTAQMRIIFGKIKVQNRVVEKVRMLHERILRGER